MNVAGGYAAITDYASIAVSISYARRKSIGGMNSGEKVEGETA